MSGEVRRRWAWAGLAALALLAGAIVAGYGRPGIEALWLAGLSLCR